jgi:DNA-binding transcriptional LysR family regulator
MNLNQLKVFYLTAKHGSLSAAAESLYITQPAVTKGIQRLQEHRSTTRSSSSTVLGRRWP